MASSRPKTRSATDHWLVGQEASLLRSNVLPTCRDVLKEILFKRNVPENKRVDLMSLVSCKFYNFESKCHGDGGCSSKSDDQKCSVFKIKREYQKAAVPTIGDRNIAMKVVDMYTLYRNIKKKKSLTTKGAVDQRNSFKVSLDSLFDVSRPDAEELIRSDSSRSRKRKEEDLAFLQDQKTTRKQGMSSIDHKHIKIMKNKEDREEKEKAKVMKEKERLQKEAGSGYIDTSSESGGAGVNTTNTDKSMESLQEQIAPRRKRRRTRSGEAQTVMLEVPKNILELTQQIATAKGVSAEAHVDLVAAFITASGGDVSDFVLSIATGYRTREKVAGIVTEKDKIDFQNICQDRSKKMIIHFDGKLVEELDPKKVNKEKKDRVAMLVRSPDLEQREQLLGIPEMKSGSGKKGILYERHCIITFCLYFRSQPSQCNLQISL